MSKPTEHADELSRVLAAVLADRQHWVDVGPPEQGRRVRFLRPEEADFGRFVHAGVTTAHVCEYVNGWQGFTEATFRGAAVGASDELPFSAELWGHYIRDHAEEAAEVARAIVDAITARLQARGLLEKN